MLYNFLLCILHYSLLIVSHVCFSSRENDCAYLRRYQSECEKKACNEEYSEAYKKEEFGSHSTESLSSFYPSCNLAYPLSQLVDSRYTHILPSIPALLFDNLHQDQHMPLSVLFAPYIH